MDNLTNIKNYLMEQIESSSRIMSRCREEENFDTEYHFNCQRKAYLTVLDFVLDEIRKVEKGDK